MDEEIGGAGRRADEHPDFRTRSVGRGAIGIDNLGQRQATVRNIGRQDPEELVHVAYWPGLTLRERFQSKKHRLASKYLRAVLSFELQLLR